MEKLYKSDLAQNMISFISFKNALGLKYETDEYYLHQFDDYYSTEKLKSNSLTDIIKSWVILRDNEIPTTQHRRVAMIREFGKFLSNSGYPDAYILPNKVCQKQGRTIPHFFTNDEILKFFCACDTLDSCPKIGVRHFVLPMLYRLLFCCGLRTCEARKIMCKDVNTSEGYIDIYSSKGPKDRRIYLPQDLVVLFKKYDTKINCILPERVYFFPVTIDSCYSRTSVSYNFKNIWEKAGLKKESDKKIRAYDFRHHFAFANINRWIEEETNVNAMLPYLMRYMDHSELYSTLYYLHLVPEFFSTFNVKTKSLENLLPEVAYEED